MNKFDRVVSILLLLQTKKIIRAQELADRFEVSLRTIYRDLRTLELAGIPIHAEAGIGYSLVEGYSLPPVMFTQEEALSFVVAQKIVEKMTSTDTVSNIRSAVDKIKAVLRDTEKETYNNLTDHIHVAERLSSQVNFGERYLQEILTAIDQKQALEIVYHAAFSEQKKTKRRIEPLGIQFYSSYWHLIAFCKLRNDYRDFRIDRIEKLTLTEIPFEKEHPSLVDHMKKMMEERAVIPVEIKFSKEAGQYARTQKYFYGFMHEEENEAHITMHFLSSSLMGMAHWLLIFIDQIEIVKPSELKEIMINLSQKLAKHYH